MRVDAFDYHLPPDRIAQTPIEPRDHARLMVVDRATGAIAHRRFADLDAVLDPGDLLVANDSRVLPARLHATKAGTGGAVEVLLLRPVDGRTWQALVRGRVRVGTRLAFMARSGTGGSPAPALPVAGEVIAVRPDGVREVRFDRPIEPDLPAIGHVPLPPYIHEPLADADRYQTVYARVAGSAAAPTAGLHFTPDLLARLEASGIGIAFATLHVGLDTFRPVEVEHVKDHVMHAEWAELTPDTARAVAAARKAGRRVVAVGTTAVRVLETAAAATPAGAVLAPFAGWTDVFITPGYRFRAVDALVTNYHLPRSTLLMLVSAFAGLDLVRRAYDEAIAGGYRFYSFGDAMLIR